MTVVDWLVAVGGLVGAVGGLAGLGVILRARAQNRRDAAEGDAAVIAAQGAEWDRLVQALYETHVKPLEDRLQKQDERLDAQDRKIAQMDEEIQAWRSRYWSAVEHIRRLTLWITRHMPDGIPAPPTPPATIADDL